MANQSMDVSDSRNPMQSRKFIGYCLAEFSWKLIVVLLVLTGDKFTNSTLTIVVVLIAGFIEAGFILGQASLDKYEHLASIALSQGKGLILPNGQPLHTAVTDTAADAAPPLPVEAVAPTVPSNPIPSGIAKPKS